MKYLSLTLVVAAFVLFEYEVFNFGKIMERYNNGYKKLDCARALVYDKDNNSKSISKFLGLPGEPNYNAIDAYWDYRINKCMEDKK